MSLRNILVHVDDAPRSAARAEAAMRIARSFDARLTAVCLTPTVELTSAVASMLPEEIVTRRVREAAAARTIAERALHDLAAKMHFERIEWRAPGGDPLQAALAHGRCADLFVLGQRDPRDDDGAFAEQLVGTVLLGSGHPILVVPYIGAPATIGTNVLVATEGGREAARAISDALPILERATRVNVLVGSRAHEPDFEQNRSRLLSWLGDHDVHCVAERFDVDPSVVGEAVLSRASDYASDLIVMGGYGQPRLRELMLGGMTRTILQSMTVPVLMSH